MSLVAGTVLVSQWILDGDGRNLVQGVRQVNVAGLQRTVSQRIAKAALELEARAQAERPTEPLEEQIQKDLRDWERRHLAITSGDLSMGIQSGITGRALDQYRLANTSREKLKALAQEFLFARRTGQSTESSRLAQQVAWEADRFLLLMDNVVWALDAEVTTGLRRQQQRQWAFAGLTLLILLVTLVGILRPTVRRLEEAVEGVEEREQRLGDKNVELDAMRVELERQNDELMVIANHHEALLAEQEENHRRLKAQSHELELANYRLEALSLTDGLTQLNNHRAFQDRLRVEWKAGTREFSVILLDVDKFKVYNDTHGHPEGDEVLRRVSQTLQDTAQPGVFLARYGGEEFAALVVGPAEQALAQAEAFRSAIERQDWPLTPVTASFGVGTRRGVHQDAGEITKEADLALYQSKHAGRNRVSAYQPDTAQAA